MNRLHRDGLSRTLVLVFALNSLLLACVGASSRPAEAATDNATAPPTTAVATAAQTPDGEVTFAGIAFVDSTVTSQGGRAKLPAGTKVFPPGSTITGQTGCPTNNFGTTGLIVAVMNYRGRPSTGSVTVRQVSSQNDFGGRPPYYLDFDPGQKLQFLGPVRTNGTYEVVVDYFVGQGKSKKTSGQFTLSRTCAG